MTVTVTEKVFLWLREHGITTNNSELYAAFPDVAPGNLRNFKKRFIDGHNPKINPNAKIVSNPVQQSPGVTSHATTLPPDLLEDISKVKTVMQCFGDGVNLRDVTSWLREMNALKPQKEEVIKTSLKNEDIDNLVEVIIPIAWNPQKAKPSTFDSEELTSLFDEIND